MITNRTFCPLNTPIQDILSADTGHFVRCTQDILSANIIDYIINISSSALFCDEEEKYYRRLDAFPLEKHCFLCYNIQIKLQKD